MKKGVSGSILALALFLSSSAFAHAATLYSEDVTLSSGWNIVSTPRVLDSHSFSVAETSANFDIYVLNGSSWSTMAALGQTEFTPLFGYFINNKTGANQTLTFNYKASTTPDQRLFTRSFTQTGWYSIGVANPTYALEQNTALVDTNNVSNLLFSLGTKISQVVDFTPDTYGIDPDLTAVGATWDSRVQTDLNALNDFRETKAYAIFVTDTAALYTGSQNDDVPIPPTPPTPGSISISMSSTPAAQNIVAGVTGFTFANVKFDVPSTSAENVRISSIPLSFAGNASDLSGCRLWDGSTALNTGANTMNTISSSSANQFVLDNSLTVTKGVLKTLAIKCDVSGSASNGNTYKFGVNDSYSYTATGIISSVSITPTVTSGFGSQMTVASASLNASLDASSPSYSITSGGSTGVVIGVYKLRATNEAIIVNKVVVKLVGGSTTDVTGVTVFQGATLQGNASFTGSNPTATSTSGTPITLPQDTDVTITIKVDLADIGTGQTGTEGSLVKIDLQSVEGVGVTSGMTMSTGATGNVAGVRVFNTFPVVTLEAISSTGVADGRLIRFKVTANSAGAVGVNKFSFSSTFSTLGLADAQLFAFTDSSYSSPVSGQGVSGQIGSTVSTVTSGVPFSINPTSNPVQVPAGQTYYFELRGSVSGVTTGSSVVTKLLGDAAFDGMGTASSVSGNFVWSPNALGTSSTSDTDWTNGYSLLGLPSSSLIQARGN